MTTVKTTAATPPPRLPVRDKAAALGRGWGGLSPMLTRLAAERATGVLVRERGALHLADGKVVHAESPAAPGAHDLLAAHGTLDADAWARALAESAAHAEGPEHTGAGTGTRRRTGAEVVHHAGRRLVEDGLLAPGALELCRLTALYDAAYFALAPSSAPGRFRYGSEDDLGTGRAAVPDTSGPREGSPTALATPGSRAGTPTGPGIPHPIPVADLERETLRRRDLLHRIWPDALVDEAPLTREYHPAPAPIPARRQAVLALVNGVRTASDIARELGRPAFHTLVDIRRLVAAGAVSPRPVTLPGDPLSVPLPGPAGTGPPMDLTGTTAPVDPHITLLKRLRDALEAL
ncbi:hypothetical protein ACFYZI_24015 [Streptomyces griseorubiginosus]|uniref:Uncharacterized protein n=1 Tax=Streptomyces griseorubiginosus TaxID=67304 RepID=A0A101RR78_9ACTN|nr:hypothetical protein [Streptomyces griseorubiginosus]KUN60098.1 hypothetical protein AQJ54_37070 [Streptomyces griseorubiginosus]